MIVLGIETSCDECSASLVFFPDSNEDRTQSENRVRVLSLATHSQVKIHQPYGGVVPEIASRNHLETINSMIDQALEPLGGTKGMSQVDAIAVTNRPGLVGALLVGVSAAKALAYAWKKPLVPVHHLEGHAASVYLYTHLDSKPDSNLDQTAGMVALPMLLAIVSGGHTNLYCVQDPPLRWPKDFLKRSLVGRSRDDAAGEAFDKIAKTFGLPYPGGVWIDRMAEKGNPHAFSLPRALPQKATFDFSFSGLKTASSLLAQKLRKEGQFESQLPDLCASVQEAIVDAFLSKASLAIREFRCQALTVVGGVAANRRLRFRLDSEWREMGLSRAAYFPEMAYCTDNAAMIAAAGAFRFAQGHCLRGDEFLTLNAIANPEE